MESVKNKKIYLYDDKENVYLDATVDVDHTNAENGRPAVIITPGGGYLCIGNSEGAPVAERFFAEGYNTFILNYSIASEARFDEKSSAEFKPVKDLEKAIAYIKENAEQLNVDADKIIVVAFSAGGHLATRYCIQNVNSSLKPQALILVYPMLDFRYRLWPTEDNEDDIFKNNLFKSVSREIFGEFPPKDSVIKSFSNHLLFDTLNEEDVKNMTPVFMYHFKDDNIISFNSTETFVSNLEEKGADFEAYLRDFGEHANPFYDPSWFNVALNWLESKLT